MTWERNVVGVQSMTQLREQVNRRLSFALSRFDSRISKTTVHLTDLNGPMGGIDKCCQIVMRIRGDRPVIEEVVVTSWPVVIDRAASRFSQTVIRGIDRTRTLRHERPKLSTQNG